MKKAYRAYTVLLFLLVVLAIVCGPHSCEWGNTVYFFAGVAALVLCLFLPALQKEWSRRKRVGTALLFALGLVVFWCAAFLLGEFRIMCRLF